MDYRFRGHGRLDQDLFKAPVFHSFGILREAGIPFPG
jgi:hypothetical protein